MTGTVLVKVIERASEFVQLFLRNAYLKNEKDIVSFQKKKNVNNFLSLFALAISGDDNKEMFTDLYL